MVPISDVILAFYTDLCLLGSLCIEEHACLYFNIRQSITLVYFSRQSIILVYFSSHVSWVVLI